ncbi:Y-family DNA polymerase [Paracoccus rhizosphaerae]
MWPIDRLRRQEDASARSADLPLILAGRVGNRRLVTAACFAAQALGLRTGMPVSKAQALVLDLRVEPADPEADVESLERLALWILQRISPIVAADPPDGVVIDSTGAEHLHGGEAAMLEALLGRLTMSGITVRAAVADSWGAAHAPARYCADPVAMAAPGSSEAVMSPCPSRPLRLPPATASVLRILGFATIGDLIGQPRAPLTRRFGPGLCQRLDQAPEDLAEPIEPLRPEGVIEVRRAFAEPIGAAETIARYIGKLVRQLCTPLAEKALGARRLDLLCFQVDNRIETVRGGLAVPQREP